MAPLDKIHGTLSTAPKEATGAIALALVAVVGLLEAFTLPDVSPSIFYIAPVALAAWYAGYGWGVGISMTAIATWFLADQAVGHVYEEPWIPWWNAGVRLVMLLLVTDLVGRLHGVVDSQTLLAETDPLTRLFNSRRFLQTLDAELDRADRYRHAVSLAYIDLNGFKAVNDTRGHHTGNAVLEAVGSTLRTQVRASDLPCRLGGDEFAVLYPETDAAQAREAVAKLRMALDAAMARRGWPVGFSIGVVTSVGATVAGAELLRLADELMYQVKRGEKEGIAFAVLGGEGRLPA